MGAEVNREFLGVFGVMEIVEKSTEKPSPKEYLYLGDAEETEK